CVTDYENVARTCSEPSSIDEMCRKIFRGTKSAGESCTSSAQCVSGSCGSEGKCASTDDVRPRGKQGDACAGTCTTHESNGESCGGSAPPGGPTSTINCYTNDGLFCTPEFTCQTIPAVGQGCFVGSPCAGEAFCDNGTCVPKRATGSCADAFDACASTASCDFTTRECVPKKGAGESCSSSSDCLSPNRCLSRQNDPSGGTCRRPSAASKDICLGT
ncbi:MAG: hypothetical protein ABW133_24170, partial [Polyangiaceae bacterium]